MAEHHFSKFTDASNFAKEVAKTTLSRTELHREGNGWKVLTVGDFPLSQHEDQPPSIDASVTLSRFRAREHGECESCQYIKMNQQGQYCRALGKPILNPREVIECSHFLALNLHYSYQARQVERDMLKRAENIHFHPQIPDNAPGKFFNKIKRK